METRKNPTSFHSEELSESDLQDGKFKPQGACTDEGSDSFEILSPQVSNEEFKFPQPYLEALRSDGAFRGYLEKLVAEESAEKIAVESRRIREGIEREAKEEGYRQGLDQARTEIKAVLDRLSALCSEIHKEKTQLLCSHQVLWIKAFAHLLNRFMVPRGKDILDHLEQWIPKAIEGFSEKNKMVVHISEAEMKRLEKHLEYQGASRFRLVSDPSLQDGQIRCECSEGGVFFSPSEEFREFESWVSRFSGVKS